MGKRERYRDNTDNCLRDAYHASECSPQRLAASIGIPISTLVKWLRKHKISSQRWQEHTAVGPKPDTPGAKISGDEATLISRANPTGTATVTAEELFAAHGLDHNDWDYQATLNAWDGLTGNGGVTVLSQLKLVAKRKVRLDLMIPAREIGYRRKPIKRTPTAGTPTLVALPSDQHSPHEDPGLDSCWLQWVRRNQPGRIVGMGDAGNMAKPSRHRPNLSEEFNDTPSENVQGVYNWWRRTLDAAGDDCEGDQLPGNHDLRVAIACAEKIPDAYDLKRPGEEHPWHDLSYLYGLEQLGVTYHRPRGEYHHAEVVVAPGFMVTHGTHAGPTGGAHRASGKHEGSRAQGHDHKQAITHVVRYRDGEPHTHVSVSVGAMCKRDLGYSPDPDTQMGFGTLTIHPNGYWNVELARYDDRRGVLVWRDQMFEA